MRPGPGLAEYPRPNISIDELDRMAAGIDEDELAAGPSLHNRLYFYFPYVALLLGACLVAYVIYAAVLSLGGGL